MVKFILLLGAIAGQALASTVLWDGRFNDLSSSTDLLAWSWSSQVGNYQYYIHGSGSITEYINLASSYKNPADTASKQGAKFTIDDTSYWNGQTMRRTELIPQTTAAINKGKVYYHFSMQRTSTNAPVTTDEHQICFFESHFTEMKYGLISGEAGTTDANLRWDIGGVSQWTTTLDPGVWHNVAYEIDFTANTVGFWHSTGASALTQVVAPKSASTSSNGADWHLGVLRLPNSAATGDSGAEDWYFSGVYIESGSLTTSVTGPAGASSGSSTKNPAAAAKSPAASTKSPAAAAKSPTAASKAAPAAAAGGNLAKYAQCGGQGWTGSGTCVSGSTCKVSNPYYSQCL